MNTKEHEVKDLFAEWAGFSCGRALMPSYFSLLPGGPLFIFIKDSSALQLLFRNISGAGGESRRKWGAGFLSNNFAFLAPCPDFVFFSPLVMYLQRRRHTLTREKQSSLFDAINRIQSLLCGKASVTRSWNECQFLFFSTGVAVRNAGDLAKHGNLRCGGNPTVSNYHPLQRRTFDLSFRREPEILLFFHPYTVWASLGSPICRTEPRSRRLLFDRLEQPLGNGRVHRS